MRGVAWRRRRRKFFSEKSENEAKKYFFRKKSCGIERPQRAESIYDLFNPLSVQRGCENPELKFSEFSARMSTLHYIIPKINKGPG